MTGGLTMGQTPLRRYRDPDRHDQRRGAMVKGKEIVYSLIAAAAVTFLTGAGVLQRVDRWMQV